MLDPVEEIKKRLDIVEIIGEHVPLKPAGVNMKGLCPFHQERTPSFMVHKERQTWKCFGCNEGGDLFTFVQKMEGIDFPTSLKLLGERAGVEIQRIDPRLRTERQRILELLQEAAGFYHRFLISNPAAQTARDYLASRNISSEIAKEWQIGYAPEEWGAVTDYLRTLKYTEDEITKAGLAITRTGGGGSRGCYDRFRARIMFPLHDSRGQAVGFSGRLLKEDPNAGGKYINSPQTLVFDKSEYVFGLGEARPAIRAADRVIVVEGQFDVVSSHRIGVKNVVAVSGTALTEKHLDLLARFTRNICFCFDADAAGERAGSRSVQLALHHGFTVFRIDLGECKDPDECVNKHPEYWRQAAAEAKEILLFLFDRLASKFDLNEVAGRRQAAAEFLPVLQNVADPITRSLWVPRLSQRLGIDERLLREKINRDDRSIDKPVTQITVSAINEKDNLIFRQTLGFLLKFPELKDANMAWLAPLFPAGPLRRLFDLILSYQEQSLDLPSYIRDNEHELGPLLAELELLIDRDFSDYAQEEQIQEARDNLKTLLKRTLNANLRMVQRLLQEAEAARDENRVVELTRQFTTLTEQIHKLSRE